MKILGNNYILRNVAMIFAVGMKRKSLRKDVRKCSPPKTQRKFRRMASQRLRLNGGGNKVIKI